MGTGDVALEEAVSYLILLGIAMPLKYAAGESLAVRIVGMAHGVLFVVFCASLLRVLLRARWPISRLALVFGASFAGRPRTQLILMMNPV